MAMRVFLAGATGVVGSRLAPLLVQAGYEVFGTTRSAGKCAILEQAGVAPVVIDVFDAQALSAAVLAVRPAIVVHQLTDLPDGLDPARMPPARMDDVIQRNARIRREGTRNLVRAAIDAGARRLIAQSIAWAYAPGPEPHLEDDPLDLHAEGSRGVTVAGVAALEALTLNSPPLAGVVLRYGRLHGPGTDARAPAEDIPLHVDAAAHAALLAIARGGRGVFNIAEPNDRVSTGKVRDELGFDPGFRLEEEFPCSTL